MNQYLNALRSIKEDDADENTCIQQQYSDLLLKILKKGVRVSNRMGIDALSDTIR